jgi:predicted dehydrogenase
MINIGFIGLGGMGRYQASAFKQLSECKIAAGSDPDGAARAEFGKLCPGAAVYIDYKDLLADMNVHAVVVAVPTGLHCQTVIDALKADCAVMVEKPMARTVVECQQMLDAADRAGKLLMVAHCRRFDVDWGTFANIYRAGRLGEQVLWRSVRGGIGPRNPWFMDHNMGGGPLFDGAIHDQDFGNWLFGDPDSVMGSSVKMDPKSSAIDTASAIIRYKNGSQMMLSWSWAVPGQSLHDVLGPKNTFVFNSSVTTPDGMKAHFLLDADGNKEFISFEPKDMYVTQAQHFLDCLRNRIECGSPGSEAIKAVAVGDGILQACKKNELVKIRW